jgi:hypothetical protein
MTAQEKKRIPVIMRMLILMVMALLPASLSGEGTDHWESILTQGSPCSYLVPSGPVDAGWIDPGFDDAAWISGPGGVGYGDGDDATVTGEVLSVYCRYHFTVSDPAVVDQLILDMDFDDGFVAYLNGTELARFNMGPAGSATSWDQTADGLHEADLWQGQLPMRFLLDDQASGLLAEGENVLSIEVHNENAGSSDLSSNLYLHAAISSSEHFFDEPPEWFQPPFAFDSTRLPLVIIDTDGLEIPNEPRITARMGIIDNGPDGYNSPGDPFNGYDGQISIETRGESSQGLYPKKSYSIETQTDSGTNNNVSLLGLPEENDFVLYGPYGDKSLIRNVISYSLFRQMGHYSPRTRLVELVVNDNYDGLYVLVEKIKRDRNRVDMATLTPDDTSALEISGGYILRIDKTTGMDPQEYWESAVQPPISGYGPVTYQYFDPDYDELTADQRSYIRDWLERFELALVSSAYKDPLAGYRSYLDIPSFTDLMILNEFTKDVDAFRLSHYFYKQRDDHGGKLVQGPPWDYNLTFGNNDFAGDVNSTENWIYAKGMTIYWWARAMLDPWFRNQVCCRWDQLSASMLNPAYMNQMIDGILEGLEDAIARNYQRWPVLGVYVWPNSFVGSDYQEEEEYLRSWITGRITWMESKWGGVCVPVSAGGEPVISRPGILKVYPNPSDLSATFVSIPFSGATLAEIRISDMNGRVVFGAEIRLDSAESAFRLPDLSGLPGGVYSIVVSDGVNRLSSRIIKF